MLPPPFSLASNLQNLSQQVSQISLISNLKEVIKFDNLKKTLQARKRIISLVTLLANVYFNL